MLGVFKDKVPLELFRIQYAKELQLREFQKQRARGVYAFDYKIQSDGRIHPVAGKLFEVPNGASARPAGMTLYEIVASFGGNFIFVIPKDTKLPKDIILYHEHSDHYSFQPAKAMLPSEFEKIMTAFLADKECLTKVLLYIT